MKFLWLLHLLETMFDLDLFRRSTVLSSELLSTPSFEASTATHGRDITSEFSSTDWNSTGFANTDTSVVLDVYYIPGGFDVAISTLGIPSNIFLFAMMVIRELRTSSHGVFIASLALLNILHLVITLLRGVSILMGSSLGDSATCTLEVLKHHLQSSHSWAVVALSLERMLSLYQPLRSVYLCTPLISLIAISVIIVVTVSVYVSLILSEAFGHDLKILSDQSLSDPFQCHSNQAFKRFHSLFALIIPLVIILIIISLLWLKIVHRKRTIKRHHDSNCEGLEVIIERIRSNNQITKSAMSLFSHHIITALPQAITLMIQTEKSSTIPSITTPTVLTTTPLPVALVESSILGLHSSEILKSAGHATTLFTLLFSNKYYRRLLYNIACNHDVTFAAPFDRAKTEVRQRGQAKLECTLPDNRKTCTRVVGLKLSSGKSSLKLTPTKDDEDAYVDAIQIAVISGKSTKENSPTEVILTETALKLSNLGATYLNWGFHHSFWLKYCILFALAF